MPPSAAHAAADLLLAVPVLSAANPAECAHRLLPVARAEAEALTTHSDRRDRMWTVDRPKSLDRVWRAIRRSRHRAFDPAIRRVLRSPSAAGMQVRHIPHLDNAADSRELIGPVAGVTRADGAAAAVSGVRPVAECALLATGGAVAGDATTAALCTNACR